jgi:hypothetical protein
MTGEVGKPASSAEDMLGLKKYIAKSAAEQERLRELIARNKEKDAFLMAHR